MDYAINSKGGFLRKTSTLVNHFTRKRSKHFNEMLQNLAKIEMFQKVPQELIQELVAIVGESKHEDGEFIFHKGDLGDKIYFVRSGYLSIQVDNEEIKRISVGDVAGEIGLLTGGPRIADVKAIGPVELWWIARKDFLELKELSPELNEAMIAVAENHLNEYRLANRDGHDATSAREWFSSSKRAIRSL